MEKINLMKEMRRHTAKYPEPASIMPSKMDVVLVRGWSCGGHHGGYWILTLPFLDTPPLSPLQ